MGASEQEEARDETRRDAVAQAVAEAEAVPVPALLTALWQEDGYGDMYYCAVAYHPTQLCRTPDDGDYCSLSQLASPLLSHTTTASGAARPACTIPPTT